MAEMSVTEARSDSELATGAALYTSDRVDSLLELWIVQTFDLGDVVRIMLGTELSESGNETGTLDI